MSPPVAAGGGFRRSRTGDQNLVAALGRALHFALEVQFGAYLAVLLGTFLPVLFLINLYIQTESRKAGRAGGQDSE